MRLEGERHPQLGRQWGICRPPAGTQCSFSWGASHGPKGWFSSPAEDRHPGRSLSPFLPLGRGGPTKLLQTFFLHLCSRYNLLLPPQGKPNPLSPLSKLLLMPRYRVLPCSGASPLASPLPTEGWVEPPALLAPDTLPTSPRQLVSKQPGPRRRLSTLLFISLSLGEKLEQHFGGQWGCSAALWPCLRFLR